ncbi:MAG: DUF998 domain-containing protein [Acidimicrobiales bacterium]
MNSGPATRAGNAGERASLPSSLHGSRLSATTWVLIGCGLGGALAFTATYAVEGVLRPRYNTWGASISPLSLGPDGWVQQVSFVVVGLLLMLSASGWYRLLAPLVGCKAFPLFRTLAGLGLVMDGLFATRRAGGGLTVHGEIHGIFAFVALGALACECFVLAERLSGEPGWQSWGTLAALAGTLTTVFGACFLAMGGHEGSRACSSAWQAGPTPRSAWPWSPGWPTRLSPPDLPSGPSPQTATGSACWPEAERQRPTRRGAPAAPT